MSLSMILIHSYSYSEHTTTHCPSHQPSLFIAFLWCCKVALMQVSISSDIPCIATCTDYLLLCTVHAMHHALVGHRCPFVWCPVICVQMQAGILTIQETFSAVNVEAADATNKSDKDNIMKLMKATIAPQELNSRIKQGLFESVQRDAERIMKVKGATLYQKVCVHVYTWGALLGGALAGLIWPVGSCRWLCPRRRHIGLRQKDRLAGRKTDG